MKLTGVMKSDKGRILLVEDEAALVNIYHDYLEKNGYDFLTTKDITEALQLVKTEQPDLVLLDIIIPKPENTIAEQGWEFLAAVKKDPLTKNIPVLMFTNLDTHQDRVKSEQMGAAGFIFKRDCSPREVLDTIAEIIKKDRERKKINNN
ncbi:MAG: response regulator [Patescibacteria group bacterium]|jgi:two-component system alkaline phosphatase synthesis response regulator PhoP